MSRLRNVPGTGFSVTCVCGTLYNTDDSHVGKRLRCQCGREVAIQRPAAEPLQILGAAPRVSRRRHAASAPSGGWQNVAEQIHSRWSEVKLAWPSRVGAALRSALSTLRTDASSRNVVRRWTVRLSLAYGLCAVVAWMLLVNTSESFLPATFLAYGPRFVLLLPLVLLVPLALVSARSVLLPLAIAAWVVVGPIMGGRVSWRTVGRTMPSSVPPLATRLLTFNVKGGADVSRELRGLVRLVQPDLIGLQECGDAVWDSLQALPNLHFHRYASLCTASRWPFVSFDSMPRAAFTRVSSLGFGGTALVARYVIQTTRGRVVLVNLHLETVRKGLEQFMGGNGFFPDRFSDWFTESSSNVGQSTKGFLLNARIRAQESERASVWSTQGDQQKAVVIIGDFNLPSESTIFRRNWGRLHDAFAESGTGFGWSKAEGRLLRIRIDHVLSNEVAPRAIGTWLGPALGSDHRPVIADLAWRGQ